MFKVLRGYCDEQINAPISRPFSEWNSLETTTNRFIFKYSGGQVLSLIRVRNENEEGQSVMSEELGLE